jgi:hypothetical protein
MEQSVKISLLFAGLFLLGGMITGVWKYAKIMSSPEHKAPVYVDIAHRSSFLYSFASLVIAKLIEFSPFSPGWQIVIVLVPLLYFALAVIAYVLEGLKNETSNMFEKKNFGTTWFMYSLIAGEIGGFAFVFGGFIYTQFIS